jgi:hypothetical protein
MIADVSAYIDQIEQQEKNNQQEGKDENAIKTAPHDRTPTGPMQEPERARAV